MDPLWTPPVGLDPELGRLDRISCGDSIADHGNARITSDWRPFLAGGRRPALDDGFVAPADLPDGTPWQLAHLCQLGPWELDAVLRAPYSLGETGVRSSWDVADDGRLAIVNGGLFNTASGREICRLESWRLESVQFLDGDRAVVGDGVLDLATGEIIQQLPEQPLEAAVSRDGRLVLRGPDGVVVVDAQSLEQQRFERPLSEMGEFTDESPSDALAPDGSWFARQVSGQRTITLLDVETGNEFITARLDRWASHIAMGPHGMPLVAAVGQRVFRFASRDAEPQLLADVGDTIRQLAMDRQGQYLATITQRQDITLINLRSGNVLASWPDVGARSLTVTTGGLVVAREFGQPLRLYSPTGGVEHFPGRAVDTVTAVALDQTSSSGLAHFQDKLSAGEFRLYDTVTGVLRTTIPVPKAGQVLEHAALSRGGRIAWSTSAPATPYRQPNVLEAWSIDSRERIRAIEYDATQVIQLEVSPDGLQADVQVFTATAQFEWRSYRIDGRPAPPPDRPEGPPASSRLLNTAATPMPNPPDSLTAIAISDDDTLAFGGTLRGALVFYRRGRTEGLRVAVEHERLPSAGSAVDADAERKKARKRSRS